MRKKIYIVSVCFIASLRSIAQIAIDLESISYRTNQLRLIRGTSLHWINDGDGLQLSKATEEFSANDSLVSSLGYNVLRIPGGYLTRWFDWEKASLRYEQQKNFDGKLEQVRTGLREMKLFARKHEMKVMYTLNINDSPAKIRELIETWNALEPKNGPSIDWFELGNENYDADSSTSAAQQYVHTVLPIIQTIRSVSPKSKIGAIIANPIAPAWDTTVYNALCNQIDFLVWHRYVPYVDYFAPNSYEATIESFATVEQELKYIRRMVKKVALPVYMTEYNLSYYSNEKVHQNVVLEPRYIFLLGNFVLLAYRNDIAGLVKHCLANAGYHTFADINFSEQTQGKISISGLISKELNRWMERQDSVAVVTFDSLYSPWEFSVLVGKNNDGVDLIIQNHTPHSVPILFHSSSKDSIVFVTEYFQHGDTMWTDRGKSFLFAKQFITRSNALTFVRIWTKGTRL